MTELAVIRFCDSDPDKWIEKRDRAINRLIIAATAYVALGGMKDGGERRDKATAGAVNVDANGSPADLGAMEAWI